MGSVNFSMDIQLLTAFKKVLPFDAFVETGTFRGDTVNLVQDYFEEIYTIELSQEYFDEARLRFAGSQHINVIHGNSPSILTTLAPALRGRSVLYFLDAHWCEAGNTAGKTSQCPLLDEIRAISSLNTESLVIIDDARLFLAPPPQPHEISQWPDFHEVLLALHTISNTHRVLVLNDTIIYYPTAVNHELINYAHSEGVDWLEVMHKTRDYDNLRNQFSELGKQLIEKDAEIHRLTRAQTQSQDVISPSEIATEIVRPPINTQPPQRLPVEGISLLDQLIEKEILIQEQRRALSAYRAAFFMTGPLWRPLNVIVRHSHAMLKPRLGNLNQYPPQALTPTRSFPSVARLSATPKISIVTPSFRQGNFIEKTLLSVFDQQYPNLEYFVQDGGSQDSTVAVLQKFDSQLSGWVSKKDSGQSQAINRGFEKTSGEIMAWLNSDDLLLPGALTTVVDYFNRHPDVDVLYGNRLLIDDNDMEIGRWILPGHDSAALSWVDYVPQETLFWRRSLWEKVGGTIDESFRFAMDWDLLVRFRDAGARFAHIPRFLGAFRIHEHQKTSAAINEIGHKEMDRIRERLLGRVPSCNEIRKAIIPFMLKHIVVEMGYRVRTRMRPK